MKMIRTGIIGTSTNLKIIQKIIHAVPDYLITGFYCHDPVVPFSSDRNYELRQFNKSDELISVSEAIIIFDQPGEYKDLILNVLKNSKHLLIFPDTSLSMSHLLTFIKLAEEAGVFLYLYHKDFNWQVYDILANKFGRPEFIDVYKCSKPSLNSNNQSIYEALYKEIFLVMKLNPVNPRKYIATSIPYCTIEPHLVNVRIEFENGTTANVTINKYPGENKNKFEIFRYGRIASIHFETGELIIMNGDTELIRYSQKPDYNPINDGLVLFLKHVKSGNYTSDPFETGIAAHKTAIDIVHQLIPLPERSCL